jgi:hypothetical protein
MGNSWAQPKPMDYSIRIPMDERDDRFVKSFSLDANPAEILHFYNTYGLLVFDNILDADEITRSVADLWREYPDASPDDPNTWEKVDHPFSFVGEEPLGGIQIWKNRQNPRVYRAYMLLYELISGRALEEQLIACFDRGSIIRPTQPPVGKPEWVTRPIYHFDINPYIWTGMRTADRDYKMSYDYYSRLLSEGNNTPPINGYPKLRSVLQLSDCVDDSGGLECFVGFNNQIKNWCQVNPPVGKFLNPYGFGIDKDNPICENMQKITVRAGSMIVFSAELPHNIFPNTSTQFRYAQYLRMTPLSTLMLDDVQLEKRKKLIQQNIPSDLEVTEIGREIFMLD